MSGPEPTDQVMERTDNVLPLNPSLCPRLVTEPTDHFSLRPAGRSETWSWAKRDVVGGLRAGHVHLDHGSTLRLETVSRQGPAHEHPG